MKKCYIAGKITGQLKKTYEAKFRRAEITVSVLGYDPVNPCTLNHDHDRSYESYLKTALIAMLGCDAVYALPDWKDSRGATIEINLAKALQMKIIYEQEVDFTPVKIVPERDTFHPPVY